MHITLRQLEIFEAVARHLSYSRAAEALHLTQPAVSMQLRQIEGQVGVPLLEQIGKTLYLTDAGRTVLRGARETLGAVERLAIAVADLKGLRRGRLSVAVTTTAEYFMPRLLGEFSARHPGIEFTLEVTNRAGLLARLGDNADDVYVAGQPPQGVPVACKPLAPNRLLVVARPDHPLARAGRVPLARIATEPFLAREPGSGTRAAAERFLAERGITLSYRMELGSNEAVKQGVLGGLGLAVLAETSVAIELAAGALVPLAVTGFPIARTWYLIQRADKTPSLLAQAFVEFLLAGVAVAPTDGVLAPLALGETGMRAVSGRRRATPSARSPKPRRSRRAEHL
ncbi:MAG: LysR substrate-binding domain-containing protein [Burkholderiales bacterium]|nr:LysR substrate-binding domain-containing protein [Burkholderiales bacterium]